MGTGLIDSLPDELRDRARRSEQPGWTEPMLATLTDERFSDPDWIFERKLDGERCLARRDGATVTLLSRNRKSLNGSYPEIAEALEAQDRDRFLVDGEVVAFEEGKTSFARLQGRMQLRDPDEARASGIAVFYYVFDLLHVDGYAVEELPLRARKGLLQRALGFDRPIRLCTHRNEHGERLSREACARGWEGLIAKDATAPYVHGRSRKWLKLKCVNEQELVIGGYTDPKGSREGFGAILVGFYDDGDLRYAGKVGTGFDDETLRSLRDRFERSSRQTPPFAERPDEKDAHWISPELVTNVGFTEWTEEGRLRHPRFLGLRRDKDPRDVRREVPSA